MNKENLLQVLSGVCQTVMEDWDNWADLIRLCLASSKMSLTPCELNTNVKELTGKGIPYRQLNFNSLEEMLKKIGGLEMLQLDDITLVKAVGNKKMHIEELMQNQKKIRRKRPWRQPQRHQLQVLPNIPSSVSQMTTSSSVKKIQYGSESNLLRSLKPSDNLQTPLLNTVPDSVPPQKLFSAQSEKLTIKLTSEERHVISHPIVNPSISLDSHFVAEQLPNPVHKGSTNDTKSSCTSVLIDSKKNDLYSQQVNIIKRKDEIEKVTTKAAPKQLIKRKKSTDRALVAKRIANIINAFPSGLIESCVVELYMTRYNESLPSDWLQLVENNTDVRVNYCAILSSANYNLQRKINSITLLEPENIKLHDFEEFWFYIYIAYSTTDIRGVIIDENHSDKIDELSQDMKIYYNKEESLSVTPGKYYAVLDSEWHRVRCIKLDEATETATVFFIDRGDQDVFPVSELRELHPKFCRLPAQSLRLSLVGLEIFEECEMVQALLEKLLVDKSVYVRNTKNNERFIRENKYADVLSAELFLEIDKEEVYANELIKREILSKIANPLMHLGPEKVAQEVYISSVSRNAIFVQLKSQGSRYLKTLIKNLKKDFASKLLRPVLRFDPSKIYIVNVHNDWLRVKIVKVVDESTAQVFCVDVGNTITVKRNNLVLLEDLSEILNDYPNQAVQVHLHKISPFIFDEKMSNLLRNLAPKTVVFHMKVVGSMEDIPMVEFYKRSQNNCLVSLNDTLVMESEKILKDDRNTKSFIRSNQFLKDVCSEFPLKAPTIPVIGSFFVVHVTVAAHPDCFKIQPFKSIYELETMMQELSKFYDSYSSPFLKSSFIKVGNMYATKQEDRWYRVYVSKAIGNESVCLVYFCDYGDYKVVSTNQLRPLENQFYDLPYQALTAKLYGIKPKLKTDWTLKDSCRFNELIATKNLVSIIKSYEMETTSTGGMILGLELIDTSSSEDIYITNVLVNENIAEKVT